jgi:dihydrolipoamide dehydrogenase
VDQKRYDLVVIGAGPGGYVAAIRAAQLGMSVACVDEHAALGGTCLRVGCIPSKAMLESSEKYAEATNSLKDHGVTVGQIQLDLPTMHARRENVVKTLAGGVRSLLKQNGVDVRQGRGRLDGPERVIVDDGQQQHTLATERILIATGSRPAPLRGVPCDGDRIGTSTEALAYPEVPRHLVVIGAGYIGLELGSVWRRLGAEVTVLEALDRILPGMDSELARAAQKIFQKQGLTFRLGVRVQQAVVDGDECRVDCEGAEPIRCDRVLLAVGRVANTDQIGLDSVGITPEPRGEIPVDDAWQTSAAGVFAIGDCIRGPKLAHKASHEAIACVERIAGQPGHVNYDAIPGVVYTHPELATVGQTEEQLQQAGHDYRKGAFPFAASGRARTLGDTDGLVKILADSQSDRILGVHILGPRAGDLIAEAVTAMEFGASAEDLAHVCHAHPTLAESLGEAALGVAGRAIHLASPRARK